MEASLPSPQTEELIGLLAEFVSSLQTWGEDEWAEAVERDRRLIADGHPDGVNQLLVVFGGTGGLSTLTIDPANGHDIDPDRVRAVNDRFRVVRGAILQKAADLRRAIDAS